MSVHVRHHDGVDAFLAATGAFLGAREAEHNLLFGICSAVRTTPELFASDPPRFLSVVDGTGRVVAASLRTPPHNQVVSEVDDPAAVDALVDALAGEPLPGVHLPARLARHFLERWAERTGQRADLDLALRAFRLARVVPPARPARGGWRMADMPDRDLVAAWVTAFTVEAHPQSEPPIDSGEVADRWIAGAGKHLYLWEDAGRVVSLVAAGGETPNGIRIGPVYTPVADRGHGYATSLTAAVSADQLARGRRFCFLFTDLANRTSNAIYQAIGYEPVCDLNQYRFERPGGAGGT